MGKRMEHDMDVWPFFTQIMENFIGKDMEDEMETRVTGRDTM